MTTHKRNAPAEADAPKVRKRARLDPDTGEPLGARFRFMPGAITKEQWNKRRRASRALGELDPEDFVSVVTDHVHARPDSPRGLRHAHEIALRVLVGLSVGEDAPKVEYLAWVARGMHVKVLHASDSALVREVADLVECAMDLDWKRLRSRAHALVAALAGLGYSADAEQMFEALRRRSHTGRVTDVCLAIGIIKPKEWKRAGADGDRAKQRAVRQGALELVTKALGKS